MKVVGRTPGRQIGCLLGLTPPLLLRPGSGGFLLCRTVLGGVDDPRRNSARAGVTGASAAPRGTLQHPGLVYVPETQLSAWCCTLLRNPNSTYRRAISSARRGELSRDDYARLLRAHPEGPRLLREFRPVGGRDRQGRLRELEDAKRGHHLLGSRYRTRSPANWSVHVALTTGPLRTWHSSVIGLRRLGEGAGSRLERRSSSRGDCSISERLGFS
jgi:hypothetical protein